VPCALYGSHVHFMREVWEPDGSIWEANGAILVMGAIHLQYVAHGSHRLHTALICPPIHPMWLPYGAICLPWGMKVSIWLPYGTCSAHLAPSASHLEHKAPIWLPYGTCDSHMVQAAPLWCHPPPMWLHLAPILCPLLPCSASSHVAPHAVDTALI
jgi:hypothetical protein